MKLYDQITVENLFEVGTELLSEKLNRYSLEGWNFVALVPNKKNPKLNLILLEKEKEIKTKPDLTHGMHALISVTDGKEITIECIEASGRIGICLDTSGESSWFVVNNNGFSHSGTVDQVKKFIDSVLEYKKLTHSKAPPQKEKELL